MNKYFVGQDPDTPAAVAAAEVERLLMLPSQPLTTVPQTELARFDLPLQKAPTLDYWEKQTDWYSRSVAEQLRRGETLPVSIPYVAQTWTFDNDGLTILFLAGEVFADYGLRLKRDYLGSELWVNAYANDVRAYIPTAQAIAEGGWEVDGARINYGIPARLAPQTEEILIRNIKGMDSERFRSLPGRQSP